MAAVSQKVIGLIGGVSQQPDSLKLPGQLRECTNYYPDPTFGLLKRPGIRLTRKLDNSVAGGTWFLISKGQNDKLLMQVGFNGTVRLWDAQSGIQQTLNALSGTAQTYATHTKQSDLDILQINDYVFFLNRTVNVAASATLSSAQIPFGYAVLTSVAYDTTYKITLDATTYSYSTPTTSGSSLNADTIIAGLVSAINAGGIYTATGVGNAIHVKRVNNADFSIEAKGGLSGTGIIAYKGTVDGPQDLPKQFLNGEVIQIAADNNSSGDDYYVKFVTSNGGSKGAGVWEETIAPGVSVGLNPTTMPHALIKEANGSYTFRELSASAAAAFVTSTTVTGIPTAVSITSVGNARWSIGQSFAVYGGSGINLRLEVTSVNANRQITGIRIARAGQGYTATNSVSNNEGDVFQITTVGSATISGTSWATQFWANRAVGDLETNPNPSFVGFPISGISFFKNRLVLMSESNIICSQAGDYLNFFASTVITLVDNDPIDISAGSTVNTQFRHGIQQADGLIVFADNSQYILQTNSEAFSASTAELNLVSNYSQSISINPVDLGATIAFIEENPTSSLVTEIQVARNQQPQSTQLTKVIPSYIPTGIVEFRNSLSASVFGIRSIQEPDAVYLFRYYTQGDERQLASWFKWKFPAALNIVAFSEDEVFFVIQADNGPVLGSMLLLAESPGGAIEFENEYIDLRLDLVDYNPSKTYDSVNEVTKIFFKENVNIASAQPCVVTTTPANAGAVEYPTMQYNAAAPAGQKYYVELDGDQTTQQFALGYQIDSTSLLPNFYLVKDKVSDNMNIPTIHRVRVYSHNSGPFTSVLDVIGRNTFTLELPQITGDVSEFNEPPMLRSAENIIPVMASGKYVELQLNCSSPFPLALVSLTWEGTYNNKGIKAL